MVTLNQDQLQETALTRRSNIASVTLIGKDAVQLGKLCRTVIDYSPDNALALLDRTDFEAIFVTKDEQVITTPGVFGKQQIAA